MASTESKSWDIGGKDKLCDAPFFLHLLSSNSKCKEIDKNYLYSQQNNTPLNLLAISNQINEPVNCIRNYLVYKFGTESIKNITAGNSAYLHYKDGYAYFTGLDIRRCRYVMMKELDLECLYHGYIVHHIDLDKLNDKIDNLFLAYNKSMHGKIHKTLYESSDNKSLITFESIRKFANCYIEEEIVRINKKIVLKKSDKDVLEKIKQSFLEYLHLLDKLSVARNNSPVFNTY